MKVLWVVNVYDVVFKSIVNFYFFWGLLDVIKYIGIEFWFDFKLLIYLKYIKDLLDWYDLECYLYYVDGY